jgi:hypothetical protein
LLNHFSIQFGTTGIGDEDDIAVLIATTSSTSGIVFTTRNVLSDGKWIHVAVVYDGSQTGNTNRCKIYINGVVATTNHSGMVPATLLNSASDHWLIGWRDDFPADLSLVGKVDEFHLYTRALSASDVQEVYLVESEGSILFNGALESPNSKLENASASLLGSSDEVTICAWLYPTGQGDTLAGIGGVAVALDEGASNFFLYHATSGENLTFLAGYSTTHGTSTFAVPHHLWTPVAIAQKYTSGSTPTIRANFQSVTPTQAGPAGNPLSLSNGFCVGNVTSQTNTWAGRIAHVQIFNRLLSAAEMDACLKDPGSVKHSLRLWLPMTSANDTADQSGNGFNGTGTALETAGGPPYDTRWLFGATDQTLGQIAIPSNGSQPATGVRGVGTRTKLTASSSLINGARFITTKGYGFSPSMVIEPAVRDVYLFGNHGVPDTPFVYAIGQAIVAHAVDIDGDAPQVSGNQIFDFKGTAIRASNSVSARSPQRRVGMVSDNFISHCFTGIESNAVDLRICNNTIANVRDYGIRDLVGAAQLSGNHAFGALTAISFEGGPSRSVGDRFSDAGYGFTVTSTASGSDIIGGTTEHCWVKKMDIHGQRVHIANCRIFVANSSTQHPGIIGCDLHWDGSRAVMTDCEVRFPDYTFSGDTGVTGSTGVYMQQHNARIENVQLTGSPKAGETGVRVLNDLNGIYVSVSSAGNGSNFNDDAGGGVNDELVLFDSDPDTNMTSGIVEIVYETGEVPVRIGSNWTSNLTIRFRQNTTDAWTELTPGTAYP